MIAEDKLNRPLALIIQVAELPRDVSTRSKFQTHCLLYTRADEAPGHEYTRSVPPNTAST